MGGIKKKNGDTVTNLESFPGNRYTLSLCINMHVWVVYCGPFILTEKKLKPAKIYAIIFIAECLLSLVSLPFVHYTKRNYEYICYGGRRNLFCVLSPAIMK